MDGRSQKTNTSTRRSYGQEVQKTQRGPLDRRSKRLPGGGKDGRDIVGGDNTVFKKRYDQITVVPGLTLRYNRKPGRGLMAETTKGRS